MAQGTAAPPQTNEIINNLNAALDNVLSRLVRATAGVQKAADMLVGSSAAPIEAKNPPLHYDVHATSGLTIQVEQALDAHLSALRRLGIEL